MTHNQTDVLGRTIDTPLKQNIAYRVFEEEMSLSGILYTDIDLRHTNCEKFDGAI
jgi:hypothetical protein